MITSQADRLILTNHFPAGLALGRSYAFVVRGRLEFEINAEVPLIRGDEKGKPLGGPSARVTITSAAYDAKSNTTRGDYVVESIFGPAGTAAAFARYQKQERRQA